MTGEAVSSCSTTTPLGSGATFHSGAVLSNAPDVMVSCHTDNSGTLFFDFSNDGVNFTTFPVSGFAVTANIHEFHTAVKGPRYFRLRLVNDSGAQSFLRLYTYFGTFRQPNAPLNQSIGADSDAVIVRSVDPMVDLAVGRFGGMEEDSKFGGVRLLDAADPATDMWEFGTDTVSGTPTKTFPTSAQSVYLSSDSASDTDVDVTIQYVDSTGAVQTLDVNLNGQTAVDTGITAFDVMRAFVSGATAAVGNIYINTANAHTGGVPDDVTTVLGYIRAGFGQTQVCGTTVPLGKTMIVTRIIIVLGRASGADGAADVHVRVREFGKTWIVKRAFNVTNASQINAEQPGLVIPARANIILRVDDVTDNDTDLHAQIQHVLVDD